jgi:hypothetical protein
MSAPGYGAEMCAHPGYARWMASVEAADANERAWERQMAAERAALDALPVLALLELLRREEQRELARLAVAWARVAEVPRTHSTASLLGAARLFGGAVGTRTWKRLDGWLDDYAGAQADAHLDAAAEAYRRGWDR